MSDGVTLEWDGDSPEELAAKFEELDRRVEANLEDAMDRVVTKIAADASRRAPYETGWLSSNIRGIALGWVGQILEGAVGTNVDYGKFQEEGTRYMDPNPYLETAIEENRQWAFEQFEQAIQDAQNEVFG